MNNNRIIMEDSFDVMGITLRTTNKEAIEVGTIAQLWQKFFTESIFSDIKNKVDNSIIALYYDFENGKEGEYSLLIGARVSSSTEVPVGLMVQHVPAQKRTVFVSETGSIDHIVFDLWQKIWVLEDQNKLERTYIADYELYDARSQNPQEAQIEIHIGSK